MNSITLCVEINEFETRFTADNSSEIGEGFGIFKYGKPEDDLEWKILLSARNGILGQLKQAKYAIVTGRLESWKVKSEEGYSTTHYKINVSSVCPVFEYYRVNQISLVGRMGQDPDSKYFESGKNVCKGSLAVTSLRKDDEGKRIADWFPFEFWGKTAEVVVDWVRKGSQIGINGRFEIETWKDKTSNDNRFKWVVRGSELSLLDSKNGNGDGNDNPTPTSDDADF